MVTGVTHANIAKSQRVQNSLARTVCQSPYDTSATGMLREKQRITYIVASITTRICRSTKPETRKNLFASFAY